MSKGKLDSAKGTMSYGVLPVDSGKGGSCCGQWSSFDGVTLDARDRTVVVTLWGHLPELVLDKVLTKLSESSLDHYCKRALYSAAAVCKCWRESALRAIVKKFWKSEILLTHPAQLLALSPVAVPDRHVKCCLRREVISNCIFGRRCMYSLYLEDPGTGMPGKFLLSAVQQSWQSLSFFFSREERNKPCGALVSNAWGFQYSLYKTDAANFHGVSSQLQIPCFHNRIGSVTYRIKWKNLTRFGRVRHWDLFMDVKLPMTNSEKPIVRLVNNPPKWNQGLRCFSLDFRGRVKLASVKNFQLMNKHSASVNEEVVLQFGKVAQDNFILDFDPTLLSTFQAFAIALASFEAT
ncbi:hypothetical protein BSKO_12131 [Bryopsis sp. KO-2023]|nr:hypothetical protein BSKO_12131 [Bryopsis sp. KO-2023]